ncbi:MAG TPA: carbohydrate kinase family protein [Bryobacteraceae bacterium]|nr:carbohydrate kinase family protein [Bryobacteraceae bacterium]
MSEKRWDVVAAGDLFIDLVMSGFEKLPALGEEGFASALGRETGGGSANTASGLAKLGARAALMGIVGGDEAEWFSERFGERQVDTSMLKADSATASAITVAVSTPADRIFYTYYGPNEQLPHLLQQPETWEQLAEARHAHFAMPVEPDLLHDLCRWLRERGTSTSIDVGWQEQWLDSTASRRALAQVDWFLPNEREAERMTPESDPARALDWFAAQGARGVAIKLGPEGSAARVNGACRVVPSIRVNPIDTTGAGDCFDAGFLWAILRGMPLADCLRCGNICGALSTQAAGGIAGFPSLERLHALLGAEAAQAR